MAVKKLPLWLLKNSDQAAVLRRMSQPVDLATVSAKEFQSLIDQMVVTMYKANGIGLAAPQIGQNIRLAVIAHEIDPQLTETLVMINPVIEHPSSEQESYEEGCLSVPKVFGVVSRSIQLQLQAIDRSGRPFRLNASGLLARAIQHEIDHLNGRLIVDRMTAITHGQKYLP